MDSEWRFQFLEILKQMNEAHEDLRNQKDTVRLVSYLKHTVNKERMTNVV